MLNHGTDVPELLAQLDRLTTTHQVRDQGY